MGNSTSQAATESSGHSKAHPRKTNQASTTGPTVIGRATYSEAVTGRIGFSAPVTSSKGQDISTTTSVDKHSDGPAFRSLESSGSSLSSLHGSGESQFLLHGFTPKEIQRLFRRFKKLDTDGNGSISREEFSNIEKLKNNPLAMRIFEVFDLDHGGEVDFEEFIEGLSTFSVQGRTNQKLQFLFNVYDMDNDGFISNGEFFHALKMMVGSNLKDAQLQQVVDKSIIEADKDGDGKISFPEFCQFIEKTSIPLELAPLEHV